MNKQFLVSVIISLLLLPTFVVAAGDTKVEAKEFFERYIILGENFDKSVADLYSDNAIIKVKRLYPNGQMKEMAFGGTKWKSLVKKSMPLGKARGDISKFSDIKIFLNNTNVTIKANRYSVLKCYTDKGYYMVIEKDSTGKYQIVEEYMETQPQSDC